MYTSVSLARRAGGVKARRGVVARLPAPRARGLGAASLCYTCRITCDMHSCLGCGVTLLYVTYYVSSRAHTLTPAEPQRRQIGGSSEWSQAKPIDVLVVQALD